MHNYAERMLRLDLTNEKVTVHSVDIGLLIDYVGGKGLGAKLLAEEVDFQKTGDLKQDVYRYTRQLNVFIEDAIRKNPEQWFWFHNRWKTRPKGGTDEKNIGLFRIDLVLSGPCGS